MEEPVDVRRHHLRRGGVLDRGRVQTVLYIQEPRHKSGVGPVLLLAPCRPDEVVLGAEGGRRESQVGSQEEGEAAREQRRVRGEGNKMA